MGDDGQEFPILLHIIDHEPILTDQIHRRFMGWLLNLIFFKLFGVSETSYFLPAWLLSSSLSIFGYAILLNRGYSLRSAMFAGLMIASAPYEILTGAVRMNDLILSWLMVAAFGVLLIFKHRAVMQGIIIAICLWLGFFTKLWVVYIFPLFFLYYGLQIIKHKKWNGFISFLLCSFLLHGAMSIFWKIKIGLFFPFFYSHASNIPVAPYHLFSWFTKYPRMIFQGSEYGTTLFGAVPYLLLIALVIKLVLGIRFSHDKKAGWDSLDFWLLFYYTSLFLLINFFPNSFDFSAYYSVHRIFRYLTPISFPMTLHLAKLIIDICHLLFKRVRIYNWTTIIAFSLLIVLNIYHAAEATRYGRTYRKNLKSVIQEVKKSAPPAVLAESWLSCFLKHTYLKSQEDKTQVLLVLGIHLINEYEAWLDENESTLPEDTMLISGLAGYVFGCTHEEGFLLTQFSKPLSSNWKIHKEFGVLDYLPVPEKVILWKLSRE
jgi:hypothetical protein